ncbi:hypothetical protein [Streptomyces griseorubiginosus]|uniref:restriction endonuclease subunit S n=1 Tax=Streptomyces griseorubiginosus TaxID=67304 RepID=UPI00331F8F02
MTPFYPTVKLGRVARIISGVGFPHSFQGRESGEYPFLKVSDLATQRSGYSVIGAQNWVSRGDLSALGARLAPTGSVVFPKVGAALLKNPRRLLRQPSAMDNNLMAVVPQMGDPRFWVYALSIIDLGELAGSGPLPFVNEMQIRDLRVSFPNEREQRRIADFLDAETARMSTLGDSLRRFDQDVREREQAVLAQQLNAGVRSVCAQLPSGWQWTPLMHLTDPLRQIMYGIVLPGPDVTDGVPIVKGGDVAANRLSPNSLNRTTREIESGYARSRLKGGDVVIAIRGSVGEVAVVPAELTGANLTQDAARISIDRSVHAEWLRLVLESPLVNHQIQQRVTGATIKGINIWDLKRVLVPTPNVETQAVLATTAGRAIQTHEDLRSRVAQHDRLLAERRQALITAAVTGQFDISTASGRNVTDGVTG